MNQNINLILKLVSAKQLVANFLYKNVKSTLKSHTPRTISILEVNRSEGVSN